MNKQISVIREALELERFSCIHESLKVPDHLVSALSALAELEAMVGEQEPVAWDDGKQAALNDWFLSLPEGRRAVLVADKWALAGAAFEAGKQMTAPVAQQPQAEPFGYVSQHTNGTWEFSPAPAGVYPDTAKSITAVYTKQPQAEAVREQLRAAQVAATTPLIGPLLDAWDGLPNDLKYAEELSNLRKQIGGINMAMEGVQPQQAEAVPSDVVRDADVEAAAKKMAEIFDYPWDFMPEKGRNTMRENVRIVLGAAIAQQKGGTT